MKPLRLRLNCNATDHYLYNGKLYIVLSDGAVVRVSLNEIFNALLEKYKDIEGIEGILTISFRRNLYWRQYPVACMLKIPEVKKGLQKAWKRIVDDYNFSLDLENLDYEVILKDLPSELLDVTVYGNKMYLACLNGLYECDIEDPVRSKRRNKLFDEKTYGLTTGYSSVILSLGSEGLAHFDPFEQRNVSDKIDDRYQSLFTSWTQAGGLMNYSDWFNPTFISNKIESNQKGSVDRYFINNFAVEATELQKLVRKDSRKIFDNNVFFFNGKNNQYGFNRKGELFCGPLNVRDGSLSSLDFKLLSRKLAPQKYGQLISGKEVADYPILEFEESVQLLTNTGLVELENEAPTSIHTYPRSSHFRDMISITMDDYISLHSIDVISKDNPELHPLPKTGKAEPLDADIFEDLEGIQVAEPGTPYSSL